MMPDSTARAHDGDCMTDSEMAVQAQREAEALADIVTDVVAGEAIGWHNLSDVLDGINSDTLAVLLLTLFRANSHTELKNASRNLQDYAEELAKEYFRDLDDVIEEWVQREYAD